jgi:Cu+-exporting ATPase
MPSTPVVAAGQAKIGDRTACPVTGTQFLVTGDSPKLDYQGKTYFFCSRTCVDQFKADPKKYLSGPRS